MGQYQFQYQLPGQLVGTRIWIQPVLKIPQSIFGKIAQVGRHKTINTRSEHYSDGVQGSIPVRGNFFLNLFCPNTIL